MQKQYFSVDPLYDETRFRRRYRVSRAAYERIKNSLMGYNDYFLQKPDCTGRTGHSNNEFGPSRCWGSGTVAS